MMGQFETRSVANLLARNFDTIKNAYQVLEPDGDYEAFVSANEEILNCTPTIDLKAFLEGRPIQIFGSSETLSRLHSLQYAYLLTRYAEKSVSESRFANALMVLSEACYFSGFAEGMGTTFGRQSSRPNATLSASHAANVKNEQRQQPVKEEILRLLAAEALKRKEKWKRLTSAIGTIQEHLDAFLVLEKSDLKPENVVAAIRRWCKRDTDFRKRLSEFVQLPALPSSEK